MPVADRNRYANLILMCNVHHKIIDDNEAVWTIEKLKKLKVSHESWVEQSLGLDHLKLRDDTVYGGYVDEWARRSHLDEWTAWSSFVLGSGQPRILAEVDEDLGELRRWLLGRVWPGLYPDLEQAFRNFARVLQDFHETLRSHLERGTGAPMLFTAKFYQIPEWDPPRYARLSKQYDFHVDLVSDLMLELTRAANLVCDQVRRNIAHNYRLADGHLIVQRGPDINFSWVECVTRYSAEEALLERPYPDLESFYDARSERDWTIGSGRPDD